MMWPFERRGCWRRRAIGRGCSKRRQRISPHGRICTGTTGWLILTTDAFGNGAQCRAWRPMGSPLGPESYTFTNLSTVGESGHQILALQPPSARRAELDLLGIGFAPLFIIEKDPLVAPFGPPELCPQFVCLPARTIQCSHQFLLVITLWVRGSYRNTNHKTGVMRSEKLSAGSRPRPAL